VNESSNDEKLLTLEGVGRQLPSGGKMLKILDAIDLEG